MNNSYYKIWDDYWKTYRVTTEEAAQIALQQVPYQLVNIELGMENGMLIYKVTIRTPVGMYEIKVDTEMGKILEVNSR
ncbi:PepSY domain-containing protein [Clostridium sp. Marseille-QA1073]